MIKFEKTKKYSRILALSALLSVSAAAYISLFVNSPDFVILGSASLTGSQTDNVFDTAALVVFNASPQNVILWSVAILAATLLAFLLGKFLDKRFGKFYCIDCLRKNPHISVKSVR